MSNEFRRLYEGHFDHDPARSLPADAPRPWYVAGYSWKSVDSVLRVDYAAAKNRDGQYVVPGGLLTYVGHSHEWRGRPPAAGTLFVLWPPPGRLAYELDKIVDEAGMRTLEIRTLSAGPTE